MNEEDRAASGESGRTPSDAPGDGPGDGPGQGLPSLDELGVTHETV